MSVTRSPSGTVTVFRTMFSGSISTARASAAGICFWSW
jgi:hypothetical protein